MDGHHGLRSFGSLVIALGLIVGLGALFSIGAYTVFRLYPERQVEEPKIVVKKLPPDVPLFNGSVFIDYQEQPGRRVFNYRVPLGSRPAVKEFYETEMIKQSWTRYVSSQDMVGFYKDEGVRQAFIKLTYVNGKVSVSIELLDRL